MQDELLSPISLNLVVDELSEGLEASGQINTYVTVASLAYADDILVFNYTYDNCQRLLRLTKDFFGYNRLDLNPQNSFLGKKVLFRAIPYKRSSR